MPVDHRGEAVGGSQGVIARRGALTVVVAGTEPFAPDSALPVAVLDAVDRLADEGIWEFEHVAGALHRLVVEHRPNGVAAVLAVDPDPMVFLFDTGAAVELGADDATDADGGERHEGEGRGGWTTTIVQGPRVRLAAGPEPGPAGWARLGDGLIAGDTIVVSTAPAVAEDPATEDDPVAEAASSADDERAPVTPTPVPGAADDIQATMAISAAEVGSSRLRNDRAEAGQGAAVPAGAPGAPPPAPPASTPAPPPGLTPAPAASPPPPPPGLDGPVPQPPPGLHQPPAPPGLDPAGAPPPAPPAGGPVPQPPPGLHQPGTPPPAPGGHHPGPPAGAPAPGAFPHPPPNQPGTPPPAPPGLNQPGAPPPAPPGPGAPPPTGAPQGHPGPPPGPPGAPPPGAGVPGPPPGWGAPPPAPSASPPPGAPGPGAPPPNPGGPLPAAPPPAGGPPAGAGHLVDAEHGAQVPLVATTVIGSRPESDPEVVAGTAAMVTVDDGQLADIHARLRIDGQTSTVESVGQAVVTLTRHGGQVGVGPVAVALVHGDAIHVGSRTFVYHAAGSSGTA